MRSVFGCLLTCIFVICCAVQALHGAEYDVKRDGTGDFESIQEAIDTSVDGDVIVVHPGTYQENIYFGGKNITLRSVDPDDEDIVALTVIDGSQRDSVVRFAGTENESCMLSGFTIQNGYGGSGGAGILGGRSINAMMRATVADCVITNNLAIATYGSQGGGLCFCDGIITNCKISHNRARGGLFGRGGGLVYCSGPISNCTISDNVAEHEGGGLLHCSGRISNCTITRNRGTRGGGLSECNGKIRHCMISGNKGSRAGGGLHDCDGLIADCTITGNSTSVGRNGGGLEDCDGTIINCVISENAAGFGGGLRGCDARIR